MIDMDCETILNKLKVMSDPKRIESSSRFGVQGKNMYGVTVPNIRKLSKEIGKNHTLAIDLWKSGVHEAKILASMIDDSQQVTKGQMEKWVKDFDSWDVCDHACGNLFDKTPYAYKKAVEWSSRKEEFVKRAGFSLMAYLAVHDKKAEDKKFVKFLSIIKRESKDERNFVKKAVNWALRGIGKRNKNLNEAAIETANDIRKINERSARWIASDALRELQSKSVQRSLKSKK